MSGSAFTIKGRDEFLHALRRLPEELRERGAQIVIENGYEAAADIRREYEAHKVTGNLAKHVKVIEVDDNHARFGATVIVRSTARHAFIFENGSQIRKNKAGKNLGAMPAGHVFIPAMVRKRRQMLNELQYLMVQAGLEVRRV